MPNRYFVDERIGCVAIRDRTLTDPEYHGLHPYTDGVVKFWSRKRKADNCPTCGHKRDIGYEHGSESSEARDLCDRLNAGTATVPAQQPDLDEKGE